MELNSYLDAVRQDLDRATALADETTRTVAEKLVTAAEPSLRLAMIQALTQAADEISAGLEDAVVQVRLEGRDPVIDVLRQAPPATPVEPAEAEETEQGTARITLRLPENVKTRADAAAQRDGLSLNSWITQACRQALAPQPTQKKSTRRVTGWA
ncbi:MULTISPECIES: YlcI/YnfO family protein [unclassified Luteococcus]|uniref:YlcI/YnfO family protein n=1 Tax=unclassified Luteococcus TaxID=2639923 RepID=UPI00313E382C